jgi:hypothetical protein
MVNSNRDPDHGRVLINDNTNAVAPAPAGGALTSLAALGAALNSVEGRSGLPMLQFKRDGSGTWLYGQRRTAVEDGSSWAVNPKTFKYGYICFDNANKPAERLVPVSLPMPLITELPDTGFKWQEQWAVNMKCVDGADAGTEVVFKSSTDGGVKAVAGLIEAVRDRLNGSQHGDNVVPIVRLEKDSYLHPQFGKVWVPLLTIVDWMSLNGPAPAPAPEPTSPPPTEQPRRRRVA